MAEAKSRKTHRYTKELKSKAVQLSYMEGVEVQQVAEALDIHPFMLSRWRKEYREGKIKIDGRVKLVSLQKEGEELSQLQAMKKEVSRLKQENSLLKKWQRFLGERRMKATSSSRETEKSLA